MSAKFEFGCLPTAIGSMPHVNPDEACAMVMKYLPDIPAWPQLSKRSPRENMVVQFSEGFPGIFIKGTKFISSHRLILRASWNKSMLIVKKIMLINMAFRPNMLRGFILSSPKQQVVR